MKDSKIRHSFEEFYDYFCSNRRKVLQIAGIILVLALAVGLKLSSTGRDRVIVDSEDDTEVAGETETETSEEIYVDISGEVMKPGLYILENGSRLYELIDSAGGLTDNADLDRINQAETVTDGQKIIIPALSSSEEGDSVAEAVDDDDGLININTASSEKLTELPGVGEAIAKRIIDYRQGNAFRRKEDIKNVNGIGDKTYEKLEPMITI